MTMMIMIMIDTGAPRRREQMWELAGEKLEL